MIVVRAPLRLSFVGGGTDLPDFYRQYPGRVISTTIDKYVYLVINRTPLIDKVAARYSTSETVSHAKELQHTRIRAALMGLGIERGLEIGSFASLPARTGLGSSSTFTVALLKGLYSYAGITADCQVVAEQACKLEIETLAEPIGKQDQYAAAFGGLNVFEFNSDNSVNVKAVDIDYKIKADLENHLLLFYSGLTRDASSVLAQQKSNIGAKLETLKRMSDSVPEFYARLAKGDIKSLGAMLHDGWVSKKSLAKNITSGVLDLLYEAGMNSGAWGGKVNGAGGGGCVMFLAPYENREKIREAVKSAAAAENLSDFREIPIRFSDHGAEVFFNGDIRVS